MPHRRNPLFTGREEVLKELHRTLRERKITAISGLGGIGKTQTAVEYAYRYQDEYAAVLWFNAETHEALISDIVETALCWICPRKLHKTRTSLLLVSSIG